MITSAYIPLFLLDFPDFIDKPSGVFVPEPGTGRSLAARSPGTRSFFFHRWYYQGIRRQVGGMTLAAVREAAGMTAAGLARRLSVPLEELLAVERGEKRPRLCEAQKWANALGLTFEEFGRHFYELADPED